MTVRELIAALGAFDPETEVLVCDDVGEDCEPCPRLLPAVPGHAALVVLA